MVITCSDIEWIDVIPDKGCSGLIVVRLQDTGGAKEFQKAIWHDKLNYLYGPVYTCQIRRSGLDDPPACPAVFAPMGPRYLDTMVCFAWWNSDDADS